MADYKYGNYGRPIYNEEKSKMSHASDHKCRPVIVDAEGRKRPIIVLPGSTETYVTKTETYIEEVYSSSDDEYHHSNTTKYEPVKYHGHDLHDKGSRHSSLAPDWPAKEVENFITKIQTEASHPNRRQSPHLRVQNKDDNEFGRHSDYNRKTANKPSEPSYTKWHNKCHSNGNSNDDEDDSDEEQYLTASHGWTKPTRATGFGPHAYDAIRKPTNGVGMMEPKVKSTSTWSRPSHVSNYAAPARDARLSAPMNDAEKALEFFKDALNLQSGKSAPKRGGSKETIDSKEAARRYENFKPPQPVKEASYTSTIDCREAARKYNGTKV